MSSTSPQLPDNVILRFANDRDAAALRRLAELDSAALPEGRLLVAEVDGTLRAAYSPEAAAVIADPFRPTAHLITLLRAHAHPPGRRGYPGARPLGGLIRRAPWPA